MYERRSHTIVENYRINKNIQKYIDNQIFNLNHLNRYNKKLQTIRMLLFI